MSIVTNLFLLTQGYTAFTGQGCPKDVGGVAVVVEEISLDQYVDEISSSDVEETMDFGWCLAVHVKARGKSAVLINSPEGKNLRIIA